VSPEAVRVEVDGPVAVVTIDRLDVANAIDAPTASLLADAFRRFDADPSLSVAVLTGAGGKFCAGADLKAIHGAASGASEAGDRVSRVDPDGDGPVGPTRMLLGKPVIAAVEGHAVAGGSSWRCGATCGWRQPTPPSASTAGGGACRSWTAARCASAASSGRGGRST
jgi:enoyl-CoA hydratase